MGVEDGIAKKYKEQIEKVLGCSQSAFYRKIKQPEKFLSIAEKQAIARVHNLKEVYLFPELVTQQQDIGDFTSLAAFSLGKNNSVR
jgi:hypothetical protein